MAYAVIRTSTPHWWLGRGTSAEPMYLPSSMYSRSLRSASPRTGVAYRVFRLLGVLLEWTVMPLARAGYAAARVSVAPLLAGARVSSVARAQDGSTSRVSDGATSQVAPFRN